MERSNTYTSLYHDHYHGLLTVRRICKMLGEEISLEQIAAFVYHFWQGHLQHHFEQEEQHVVPAL